MSVDAVQGKAKRLDVIRRSLAQPSLPFNSGLKLSSPSIITRKRVFAFEHSFIVGVCGGCFDRLELLMMRPERIRC